MCEFACKFRYKLCLFIIFIPFFCTNTIFGNYRFTLWRTVHRCTLSHVLPQQNTDRRVQQRPPLSSSFPHHARTGIQERPESREGQFARGGEPGHTERRTGRTVRTWLSWWVLPTGGYLQYPPTTIHGLGLSFRCAWLTLAPTSLADDVFDAHLTRTRCALNRHVSRTWAVLYLYLTRNQHVPGPYWTRSQPALDLHLEHTWPAPELDTHWARTWPELDLCFDANLIRTWRILEWFEHCRTRPNAHRNRYRAPSIARHHHFPPF